MKKRISFCLIALFAAILMQAQSYPVDVAKLNAAYEALTKDPNSLKRQQDFFNAFPSTWMEYILTYQYPPEKKDKAMYYNTSKHMEALKNLTLIPDSIYCEKLVNLAVGGKWNSDAPSYLQILLSHTMENRRDAMFKTLAVPYFLLKGERLQFWQFYWANIVDADILRKRYQQLIAFAQESYPEEVEFISIAFKYFHSGVSIPNDYPHLNPGVSIRFPVGEDKRLRPVELPSLSAQTSKNIQTWKKKIAEKYPSKPVSAKNFEHYDLQTVLKKEFSLGYIGANYQRMYITFKEIQRNSADEYAVKGFSKVKNNTCAFAGTIKNIEYSQLYTFEYGLDDEMKDSVINQGYLLADFVLYENRTQQGSGIFRGLLKALWYIDQDGVLHCDDLGYFADNASNNQYYGEWVSYITKTAKPVAWGDWEIPMCGDLDISDCEFLPNPKYRANGWEEYKK
jgi:hypothetical protein